MDIITIIIFIIVGLAVLVAFLVFLKAQKRKLSAQNQNLIKREWNKILNESKINPNLAILEADKLLDHVLKFLGYRGSLGEKLKKSGSLFSNLDDVWKVHKMRNKIAHEIGVKVGHKTVSETLKIFKIALRDLGAKL